MARGHRVTVYCRERHPELTYRGVSLVYLPTWRHKYFDTIVHTFFSTVHLIFHRADVALYCNGANAIFTLPPRPFGIPTLLNVDGLERKRKKWNRLAKAWYAVSEWLATFCPSVVITDARQIEAYYLERYGKRTQFIPYGAETGKTRNCRGAAETWPGTRPLLSVRQPDGAGKQCAAGAGSFRAS